MGKGSGGCDERTPLTLNGTTEQWTVLDEIRFSEFVTEVYGRPYCLQQQGDMYGQGEVVFISVPPSDGSQETDPAQFQRWLEADPTEPLRNKNYEMYKELAKKDPGMHESPEYWTVDDHLGASMIRRYWERDFYPPLGDLLDDMHQKGYLKAGDYKIHVQW